MSFKKKLTVCSLLAIMSLGQLAGMSVCAPAEAASPSRPQASRLLPDTTVGVLTIFNARDAVDRFMTTSLGKMLQDPQMKPVVDSLYGSLGQMVDEAKDQIGLGLGELLALPQGEVVLAIVAPKDSPPALVILMYVGDQIANARKLLDRGTAELEKAGATKSEESVGDTKLTVFDNLPGRQQRAVYFEKDSNIVIGTDVGVLRGLLDNWGGPKGLTLAENPRYAGIINRCRWGKDDKPQAVWFVDPIGLARALARGNTQAQLSLAVLPALGLDGLTAIGGTVALDVGGFESITQAHISLESPRSGVIKMIAFEPVDPTPERWVPADVAGYTTFKWNIETTYSTLGVLYDSFRGEGAFGRDLLERMVGATGLEFDKDLLPALEGRITIVNWIQRPITIDSQVQLYGLKLKDTELAAKSLEKLAEKFADRMTRKSTSGKEYFQIEVPRGRPAPQQPAAEQPQPEPPRNQPSPPQPCIGILDDYLIMTTRPALYEKVVRTFTEKGSTLADELDFKLVSSRIQRSTRGLKPVMVSFERPEEGMRFLYEMAGWEQTRGQLSRAAENSRFLRAVDSALKQNPLPPFEVIKKYLAPSGAVVVDDETGIHYTAFTLKRTEE